MSREAVRLDVIKRMRDAINATERVKSAFDEPYFTSLESAIHAAEENPLQLPDHVFFIAFMDRSDLIPELEATISALESMSGRRLTTKIRMLSGSHADVISSVFELRVLGRFIKAGCLTTYEPRVGKSKSVAEAMVMLGGDAVLVEAQSKMQAELSTSAEDDEEAVKKLHAKLMQKCSDGQLANADGPAILFQNTDFGLWDRHVDTVVEKVAADPNCASASVIVFGDAYTSDRFRVWVNPNTAHALPQQAIAELREMFDADF